MAKNKIRFQKRLFFKNQLKEKNLYFGKFSDRDKSYEQLMFLQEADNLFSQRKNLDAFEKFLLFITDNKNENVRFKKNKKIEFDIVQGSKIISGYTDGKIIKAETELFSFDEDIPQLYQTLLEQTHNLKFTKFFINKNVISAQISLYLDYCTVDLLYYSLRELSVISDKLDDYLELQFQNLTPLNKSHIMQMPDNELNVKTKYLKEWLAKSLELSKKLDNANFADAKSFILISTIYRILYLIVPEGELDDTLKDLEKFFFESQKSTVEKNKIIEEKLKNALEWDNQRLKKSLYKVIRTFPEKMPSKTKETISFIQQEIGKIYWYESNKFEEISRYILEYIAGYIDAHFGNIPVLNDLFLIFWQVMYKDYFNDLGINRLPYEKLSQILF